MSIPNSGLHQFMEEISVSTVVTSVLTFGSDGLTSKVESQGRIHGLVNVLTDDRQKRTVSLKLFKF